MKFGVFEQHLAVDEIIVKYYGHNILKQFTRGKSIRFSYKFWALRGVSDDTILICILARAHLKTNTQTYCLDQKLHLTC